ncbi:dioxygenase, partial [Streptomyces sp. NPDC003857]
MCARSGERHAGAGSEPARVLPGVHDFVRETRLTREEWEKAVGFLTETGQ